MITCYYVAYTTATTCGHLGVSNVDEERGLSLSMFSLSSVIERGLLFISDFAYVANVFFFFFFSKGCISIKRFIRET